MAFESLFAFWLGGGSVAPLQQLRQMGITLWVFAPEDDSAAPPETLPLPKLLHLDSHPHRHRGMRESHKFATFTQGGATDFYLLQRGLETRNESLATQQTAYTAAIDAQVRRLQSLRMTILWKNRS